MSKNIKLIIAYDGSAYKGWQKISAAPSIEGTLQVVLEQILQEPISLQAASRTDAGVHAQGQVVNFVTSKAELDLNRLHTSINSLLPSDIVVRTVEEAASSFHPTLHCTGKEYGYSICGSAVQLPHQRHYSWHVHYPLNLDAMRQAAKLLQGTQDFSAFCNVKKNESYTDHIRTIHAIALEELPEQRLHIRIIGNHFLYKMVRNIVGTLVYVGRGKIALEEISSIVNSQDRTLAGMTAPAHGLSLNRIDY